MRKKTSWVLTARMCEIEVSVKEKWSAARQNENLRQRMEWGREEQIGERLCAVAASVGGDRQRKWMKFMAGDRTMVVYGMAVWIAEDVFYQSRCYSGVQREGACQLSSSKGFDRECWRKAFKRSDSANEINSGRPDAFDCRVEQPECSTSMATKCTFEHRDALTLQKNHLWSDKSSRSNKRCVIL